MTGVTPNRKCAPLTSVVTSPILALGVVTMTSVTLEEARETLSALAAKVAADGEPVRVTRGRGRRSVVIVSAVELEALRVRAEAVVDDGTLTAADARAVRRGRAAIARGDFKTLEEIEAAAR